MTDSDAVLEANAAFYRAFGDGDLAAMDAVWARTPPVSCIHPGWSAITGREPVMESWRAILSSPPPIRAADAEATVLGAAAFVICIERIAQAALIATNIFIAEGEGWKMVHHQAGHIVPQDVVAPAPERTVH